MRMPWFSSGVATGLLALVWLGGQVRGEGPPELPAPLTLPPSARPAWLREEGIVMAGSWEPFFYRVRRDNFHRSLRDKTKDAGFDYTADELAGYRREHTQAMLEELKALGVNFVLTHCYKGAGFEAERPGMEDARKFAELAHQNGMRVGVYLFSGTSLIELLRKEHPDSADWEVLDSEGKPIEYGDAAYRRYVNRNHPAVQAHLKPIIRYAVEEIRTDLLHFDNYFIGPGFDRDSVERFRSYLQAHGRPEEFGLATFDDARPPKAENFGWRAVSDRERQPKPFEGDPRLYRAWIDFCSDSLAESLYDVGAYARSLRSDVLIEANTGLSGISGSPVDPGRILRYSDGCYNEASPSRLEADGTLKSRIPAYKAAQAMNNFLFAYIRRPIDAAESLAYNTDCLGCIAWFEGGKIVDFPASTRPVARQLLPYVRFFREQRSYYRNAERVADVAALRSFASHMFVDDAYDTSVAMERKLIESKVPWAAVYGRQLGQLDRFACLSVVGADALGDGQLATLKDYVRRGGGLLYSGRSGMVDENLEPRSVNPFDGIHNPRVVKVDPGVSAAALADAIATAAGRNVSLAVEAPAYVTTELCEQATPKRRLVHLVNYQPDAPVKDVKVRVLVPEGWNVRQAAFLAPEQEERRSLPFEQTGNCVRVAVPRLDVYALISIEAE